jgi:hypothetical protein
MGCFLFFKTKTISPRSLCGVVVHSTHDANLSATFAAGHGFLVETAGPAHTFLFAATYLATYIPLKALGNRPFIRQSGTPKFPIQCAFTALPSLANHVKSLGCSRKESHALHLGALCPELQ